MKIKRIEIKKLHGDYDYKIEFDNNLTFLYGSNGCGKTTILNILAAIITGKIYNLVEYVFSKIVLTYGDTLEQNEKIEISVEKLNVEQSNMIIMYNNESYIISDIVKLQEKILYRNSDDEDFDRHFYSLYPFALEIKKTFNYVYLPLSRYGNENYFDDNDYYRYISHRNRFSPHLSRYNTYLNDSLRQVEGLIRKRCMNINYIENRINEQFRNDVLSSSISVSSELPISKILSQVDDLKWDDVLKSKDIYIKTLEDINIYSGDFKNKIDKYFEEFKDAYEDYQLKKNSKEKFGIRVDFAWQYAEFLKIESIAKLAKVNEKKKEKVRKPKEMFLEVINDFFCVAGLGKKIEISGQGEVYFNEHKRKLRLFDLSSGEKQIVITFASLIFGLENKKMGIFIVDEPEASLHLEWQSKFVSKILEVDKNIQLIFATHSPELIGKYRTNAIELVKTIGQED